VAASGTSATVQETGPREGRRKGTREARVGVDRERAGKRVAKKVKPYLLQGNQTPKSFTGEATKKKSRRGGAYLVVWKVLKQRESSYKALFFEKVAGKREALGGGLVSKRGDLIRKGAPQKSRTAYWETRSNMKNLSPSLQGLRQEKGLEDQRKETEALDISMTMKRKTWKRSMGGQKNRYGLRRRPRLEVRFLRPMERGRGGEDP